MARNLVKHRARAPQTIDADDTHIIEAPVRHGGAFTFQYSYTEISSFGGRAHVKSRRTRYEGGRLSEESFDGEFDRSVYDTAVNDMQRAFADQASLMLRTFSSLFTLPGAKRRDGG